MMDFTLKHNDLEISNGDICLCNNDVDAIAQVIAMRLKTMAGEWFLDTNIAIFTLSNKIMATKQHI